MDRLFISLNLPQVIKDRIDSLRIEASPKENKLKWEPKDKLHITLKFIGDVAQNLIKSVSEELNFIENYKTINCQITHFGFFFSGKKPRILWLGLHADEIIFNLVEELNSRLEKFLIPREKKKFTSHVTILRIRGNISEHFVANFKNFNVPQVKFQSNEVPLIKSQLLPQGSIYKEIKKYKLK